MRFTLRQLSIFAETARCGNISEAADRLAMTQSAASSALKGLEEQYSTQLFDRVGKRLQLNAMGQELLPYVEGLLTQVAEVEDVLQRREPSGSFNIGATLTIGNYLAIPLITAFKKQYPLSDLKLHIANTEQIAGEVLAFRIDMGLIEGEYSHPDLYVQPWRNDELAVFCSPEHSLANTAVLNDAAIVQAQWVTREQGSGTRQTFDRAMQGLHNDTSVFMELEHTEAIKCAVDTGDVLGCISRIALEDDFRRGRYVELSVPHRDMRRKFYLVTHRKKFVTQNLERWISHCRSFSK